MSVVPLSSTTHYIRSRSQPPPQAAATSPSPHRLPTPASRCGNTHTAACVRSRVQHSQVEGGIFSSVQWLGRCRCNFSFPTIKRLCAGKLTLSTNTTLQWPPLLYSRTLAKPLPTCSKTTTGLPPTNWRSATRILSRRSMPPSMLRASPSKSNVHVCVSERGLPSRFFTIWHHSYSTTRSCTPTG